MNSAIRFFIQRPLFGNLITVAIIVAAPVVLGSFNREAFPSVQLDKLSISARFEGASPAEVEKLVVIPIERELKGLEGIKNVKSSAAKNQASINVELDPDLKNRISAIQRVRDAVDRARIKMPLGVKDMTVDELGTGQTPVIKLSLTGTGQTTETELREHVRGLEDLLYEIPGVSQVARNGYRDREIFVEINPQALAEYAISSQDIINSLRDYNVDAASGTVLDLWREYSIRTDHDLKRPEQVEDVLLRSSDLGVKVNVGKVARARDTFEKREVAYRVNGDDSIYLTVSKSEKSDAITVVEKIREVGAAYQAQNPDIVIRYLDDESIIVSGRLSVLSSNVIIGLMLIFISLYAFLGWRMAAIVGLGVVFAFAMSLIGIYVAGITLNMVSLLGLIIVSGMLVDDSIIVSENIHKHIEAGTPPLEAALKGSVEMWAPILTSVLTSMLAFLPLLSLGGVMGKVVWVLPVVVILALLASFLECFFILPSHTAEYVRHEEPNFLQKKVGRLLDKLTEVHHGALTWLLRRPRRMALATIPLFFVCVGLIPLIGFSLFPPGGENKITVKVQTGPGISLDEMQRRLGLLEKVITSHDEQDYYGYLSVAGRQSGGISNPFANTGNQFGELTMYLVPEPERDLDAGEIVQSLKDKWRKTDPRGELFKDMDWRESGSGPPVGEPVSIEIRGEDFETLIEISKKTQKHLEKIEGVFDVGHSWEESGEEIHVVVDDAKAIFAGVSTQDISSTLTTAFLGTTATTIREFEEEIEVRVIYPEEIRTKLEGLKRVRVRNSAGNLVPITRLVGFKKAPGPSTIKHVDYLRTIYVTANIDPEKTDAVAVATGIQSSMDLEMRQYPGYRLVSGGEFADTQESLGDLGIAALFGVIAILGVTVLLYGNLKDAFLIFASIPLSFAGVSIVFFIHNIFDADTVFSFFAGLGVVGLAGVAVNDSIILISTMNELREQGRSLIDSIHEACALRLRPILLTTITTGLGLLPTAYGIGGLDVTAAPMALALGWGMVFSSANVLLLIPLLYFLAYRNSGDHTDTNAVNGASEPQEKKSDNALLKNLIVLFQ